MATDSQTHTSLIQGISQQSDFARGTASCEDQENCLNEVLSGVVSRMGTVYRASINKVYSDPFVHEIIRDDQEQYLVIIENGDLEIINRVSGSKAAISGDISAYLAQSGVARRAFQAVTIGDTTFLLNRQVVARMATAKSPSRPNNAVAYLKAAGYKVTFTLNLKVGTKTYSASWTTPDNSESGNAAYIVTDYIAEQFRLALVNTMIPLIASEGNGTFSVVRYGSTLVVTGDQEFDIWTTDGVGDTCFLSFKDNVKKIADLPTKCSNGYQVSVAADGSADSEKYFLKYVGGQNTGRWEEVVAPDTETSLNAATMPHLLVNTGPNAFQVKQATWGSRVAGDGENTSRDPSFVGYPISSIQFFGGRLAGISEFNMILSRARNAYVYFPDTAQTTLDSAPIDYDISNGSSTLIQYGVVAGGKLQFWGDLQQTYLDTGQEALKEKTTDVLPLANYEYDGECPPKPLGMSSLLFGTTLGRWGKLTEVFFRGGVPQGEIVVSAHVPKLLDGKFRLVAAGEASSKTLCLTDRQPSLAYLYQSYNQGSDRVQSAWNKWTFPAPNKVLWAGIMGNTAYFLFQWSDVCSLETMQLDETGDEESERFPLRLDHRVSEAAATYATDHFTLALPYSVPASKQGLFSCFERTDVEDLSQRGRELAFEWVDTHTVRIPSGSSSRKFHFGAIPVARRRDSRLYARDRQGQPVIHDRLIINKVDMFHKDTVEYDIVVHKSDGTYTTETYTGRVLGDATVLNNEVPVKTGSFSASVGHATEDVAVEVVNKTPFPAIWSAAKYIYDITVRDKWKS